MLWSMRLLLLVILIIFSDDMTISSSENRASGFHLLDEKDIVVANLHKCTNSESIAGWIYRFDYAYSSSKIDFSDDVIFVLVDYDRCSGPKCLHHFFHRSVKDECEHKFSASMNVNVIERVDVFEVLSSGELKFCNVIIANKCLDYSN